MSLNGDNNNLQKSHGPMKSTLTSTNKNEKDLYCGEDTSGICPVSRQTTNRRSTKCFNMPSVIFAITLISALQLFSTVGAAPAGMIQSGMVVGGAYSMN
jgi:hypothetical protein